MTEEKGIFKSSAIGWLFVAFLIGFIVLKIPHLSLPFFWDETGVYGKIIFDLSDLHLSLHPKAIDQWTSRGHPLLYPNIIALFCKLFGNNVTVAHIGNFTISCLLLISIYKSLSKAFHPWIGFTSAVLLMAIPIFYTQSVFVLPEIALTFFLWWTTLFFIQKKYFLYFLSGSAAVLVKEPAIVWICSLMLWELIANRKSLSWKMLWWLTPLIPFLLFIYIQKQTLGWYFFPYHTGGFELNIKSIYDKLLEYMMFLFWRQGRMIWMLVILLYLVLTFYPKSKKTTSRFHESFDNRYLCGLFAGIVYVLFSSTTFYGVRYIMPVLPIATSLVSIIGFYYLFRQKNAFILLFAVTMGIISFQFMSLDKFNYDNDMSYIRSIESSKKTIRYMLDRNMLIQDQFTATIPLIYALSDPRFGYLPPDTTARYSRILHPGSKYAVQIIPGTQIENPDQLPLSLLEEWYDGDIITRIYKVMPLDTSLIRK